MNPIHASHYLKLLQDARVQLRGRLKAERAGATSSVDAAARSFGHSEDSHAQLISAKDDAFALADSETLELEAIDAALARLNAGTYGLCVDCAEPIATARLDVEPQAIRCLDCQTAFENKSH